MCLASLDPCTTVVLHPCPQHTPRTTNCVSCGNHSIKFVQKISYSPSSTSLRPEILQHIWRYKRGSRFGIRMQKYEGVARGWSRIEICSRYYSTADGKSQLDMKQGSHGKRRSATKALARLHIANATCAVRSCVNHPSQCCLVYECIELNIFYSVTLVTFHEVGNEDEDCESENQLFSSDYAEERSVEQCATFSLKHFLWNSCVTTTLSVNVDNSTFIFSPRPEASSGGIPTSCPYPDEAWNKMQ